MRHGEACQPPASMHLAVPDQMAFCRLPRSLVPNVRAAAGLLRPLLEIATTLGSTAGVVQTLVLGASLASLGAPSQASTGSPARPQALPAAPSQPPWVPSGGTTGSPARPSGTPESIKSRPGPHGPFAQLREQGTPEILITMAAVRFLVVPAATLGLVAGATKLAWLPMDGSCRLALLLLVSLHAAACRAARCIAGLLCLYLWRLVLSVLQPSGKQLVQLACTT